MAKKTPTAPRRVRRLVSLYYETARNIRWALSDEHETAEAKNSITEKVSQLAKLAGTDFQAEGYSAASDSFIAAVRAIVSRTGKSHVTEGKESRIIAAITDEAGERWKRYCKRSEAQSASSGGEGQKFNVRVTDDNDCYEAFGVHPSDDLEYMKLAVDDFRAGDLVLVRNEKKGEWSAVGRFDSADEEYFRVLERDGKIYRYERGDLWSVYLTTSIGRRTPVERGKSEDLERAQREAQIAALYKRLDELTDYHEEGARFRVLRQIYDLENAPQATDEWPELIDA